MMLRAFRLGLARGLALGYVLGDIAVSSGCSWVQMTREIVATGMELGLDAVEQVLGTDDPGDWLEERVGLNDRRRRS